MTDANLSVYNYRFLTLSNKQIKAIDEELNPAFDTSLTELIQSRTRRRNPEYYSLRTLLQAMQDTADLFQQYDIDEKNAKGLVKSIFFTDKWLQRDPAIAYIRGRLYIIGGRHRITAMAAMLSAIVMIHHTQDDEREEEFNTYLEQFVRVEVTEMDSTADLLSMVFSDNQSRIMRAAEKAHLTAQTNGADARTPDNPVHIGLVNETNNKKLKTYCAQYFTRQESDSITPNTRQLIGEKLSTYILFGVRPGERLSQKTELLVNCVEDFVPVASLAWQLVQDEARQHKTIARQVNAIVEAVIRKLPCVSKSDDLFEPVAYAHEFEAPPTRRATVVDDAYEF